MFLKSNEKKGRVSPVFLVVVLILGGIVYYTMTKPTNPDKVDIKLQKANQATADSAFQFYLTTVYKHMHGEAGGEIPVLRTALTLEDWQWFRANYLRIFEEGDLVDLGSAMSTVQKAAGSQMMVLRSCIEAGPNTPNVEQLNRDDSQPDIVVFTVRQPTGFGGYRDYQVSVVKVGKFWRTKGFENAQKRYSGNYQPFSFIPSARTEATPAPTPSTTQDNAVSGTRLF